VRQKQVLEAGFGLELPDTHGDCPATQNWLPMWDVKALPEGRGIPAMAGSPLANPESVSFPCRVLPRDTSPKGGHLSGTPKVWAQPDSAPGCSPAPAPSPGLGHQGPLPLHRHLEASWRADPITAGLSCACRISLPSPCPCLHALSLFLPSTSCWNHHRGKGAASHGCRSGW